MNRFALVLVSIFLTAGHLAAETCTAQSALSASERTTLADAARTLAVAVQANDVNLLRSSASGDLQKNFGALQYLVAITAPKLAGGTPEVEQLYILDATNLKPNPEGSSPEAQFFCVLKNSSSATQFAIAGLTSGQYAFAMVTVPARPAAWRISMLLRQEGVGAQTRWLLAGIYPKPLTIAGHDGLWYWKEARQYSDRKQPWNAWLFYQAAATLLRPADFVQSSHLDKLRTEEAAAAPPALSEGLSPETPLVLKSPSAASATSATTPRQPGTTPGTPSDLRFTSLALGDPPASASAPMLLVHLRADPLPDPAAARQRNTDAARTLLSAYPELRTAFRGLTITADSPGQPPLTTDVAVADVH